LASLPKAFRADENRQRNRPLFDTDLVRAPCAVADIWSARAAVADGAAPSIALCRPIDPTTAPCWPFLHPDGHARELVIDVRVDVSMAPIPTRCAPRRKDAGRLPERRQSCTAEAERARRRSLRPRHSDLGRGDVAMRVIPGGRRDAEFHYLCGTGLAAAPFPTRCPGGRNG